MKRYLRKRIFTGLICIFIALCLNFLLIHLAPGDPARIIVGTDNPNPEIVKNITEKYGLDQPLFVQFLRYVGNLLHGDLGNSYYSGEPVATLILQKIGPTLLLALTGALLAVLIGTIIGVYCARKTGGWFDTLFGSISYLFDATPSFWLGLMLIMLFASTLKLLPSQGMLDSRSSATGIFYILDVMKHMILPVVTLALALIPYYFRIARSTVLQVMGEDFIVTLRAAGVSETTIFYKYVLRNAILPTVTSFGIQMAYLITGSAIVEIVFSWPGMGSFIMSSISKRDYPVLMGIYFILSIFVVIMMLIVDILYTVLDPRVTHTTQEESS